MTIDAIYEFERLQKAVESITGLIDAELSLLGNKGSYTSTYPFSSFATKAKRLAELGQDLMKLALLQKDTVPSGYYDYPHCVIERGYKILYSEDYSEKISEHRYVMAIHLGRKLSRDEIVHHLDENKLNNEIGNLEIMTAHDHGSYHSKNRHKVEKSGVKVTWEGDQMRPYNER